MNKVTLSALAAMLISGIASAEAATLYTDSTTGQVYTKAGEGRVELIDADAKDSITVLDKKSPMFLLGQETGHNLKIKANDNKDMYLKIGTRLQSTFETRAIDYSDLTKKDVKTNDAYLRRVRLEIEAGFDKHTSFTMDLRNDNANAGDSGERSFNVGDAYLTVAKPFDSSLVNFKLYRGKIDVSRTETVKSAYTLHYDRPQVADEAAQFITHNRRGTNAQVYGDWHKKIQYQLAFGDGVYSGALHDAKGIALSKENKGTVESQDFFYGGKLKLSPFDGWEEIKLTDTYMGEGKHFTLGAAYWKTGNIVANRTSTGSAAIAGRDATANYAAIAPIAAIPSATTSIVVDHKLVNLEASAHYYGASVSAEYFAFDGVVKDWTKGNAAGNVGKSTGWYTQAEYVLVDFGHVAPFYRFESWDKFNGAKGYDLTSKIAGVNWYLRGNTTKVGLSVQQDTNGLFVGNNTDTRYKVTSQFFF